MRIFCADAAVAQLVEHILGKDEIMKTGKKLKTKQKGRRVVLTGLPPKAPDRHDTVVILKSVRE